MSKTSQEYPTQVLLSISHPLLLALFCLVIAGLAACSDPVTPVPTDEPLYRVASTRPSSEVSVSNEGESAFVEVYSDTGIGSATVTLIEGSWPETIVMRFHLNGLERLQFMFDKTVIHLSVTSQNMILQSVAAGSAEQEIIADESPYWMAVTFLDETGTTVEKPAADGVIEVQAPAAFLAAEATEFTINWIDFHR